MSYIFLVVDVGGYELLSFTSSWRWKLLYKNIFYLFFMEGLMV